MTNRLAFIVNPSSGGQRGAWLMERLAAVQPASPVVAIGADLLPLVAAMTAAGQIPVACGGDGTAAAVAEAAWRAKAPCAGVIPLGTGNDLARHLGWPAHAPNEAGLPALLQRLAAARTMTVDRWRIVGPGLERTWFNYLSVGFDARIARSFHQSRLAQPWAFRHRLLNLAHYGMIAAGTAGPSGAVPGQWLAAGCRPIPPWAGSLVLANITSYGGGVRLSPTLDAADGHLDAFVLAIGVPAGLVFTRLRRARRLGRAQEGLLRLLRPTSLQIDGEALHVQAGEYRIARDGQVSLLSPE